MTLFVKQNKYHSSGVIGHTLKVTFHLLMHGRFDLLGAGLLHDIGKPVSAYHDAEDIKEGKGNFSFTNHEEYSYWIIRKCPSWLISDFTKEIVRKHYLIRGMYKAKKKGKFAKYARLKRMWDNTPENIKKDLGFFMKCDDLGKKTWLEGFKHYFKDKN